jgi:selT/selW/selH-like putative selenoprotein
VALSQNVLSEHKKKISSAILKPSGSKAFEVKLDDELLFSKKVSERYPNENEVEEMIREKFQK